jgi:D-tyrosyl-tRNA(Tyr) deacylase
MRALIQRVSRAQVSDKSASNKSIASIGKGMLILAGFEEEDTPLFIEQIAQKIKNLRIFSDEKGKMNVSGPEVSAEYMIVSQFTLYADCRYGNRPSFERAAERQRAKEYYEHFVRAFERLSGEGTVRYTPFGSDLAIELVNDGPVTLWIDSHEVLPRA